MAATANRNYNTVLQWNKLFPSTVTDTYTSSFRFMKLLTTVAVSTICSLKGNFPGDNFKVETFAGLRLSILKTQCDDEIAQFVGTTLLDGLEAFDKHYLDKLALCFYKDECKKENLVSSFIFEYSYAPSGVTMSMQSTTSSGSTTCTFTTEEARKQTISLLHSCHQTVQETLEYPPPVYEISIRLYYNDDAPEGYQAPGFWDDSDQPDHLDSDDGVIGLGAVTTPYHRMVASCLNILKRNTQETNAEHSWDSASQQAVATQSTPVMSSGQTNNTTDINDAQTMIVDNELPTVRCPCDINKDLNIKLIKCKYCGYYQHAVCFGIIAYLADALKEHCCVQCFDEDNTKNCTDAQLLALSASKRKSMCIFRRTLQFLLNRNEIDVATLKHELTMTPESAKKLINRLVSYGIIIPGPDTLPDGSGQLNLVNKEKLREAFKNHFYSETVSDMDLADGLVSETFTSEMDQSDHIRDMLDSMDRVGIETGELGRVVRNERVKAKVNDATLKQYEEALSYVREASSEELPLSGEHNPVQVAETTLKTGVRTTRKRTIQHDDHSDDDTGKRRRAAAKKKKTTK